MLLQLQDGSVLVPLVIAEPDVISGYLMDDPERKEVSASWQDVAAFMGSYNFAEDGDFEVLCNDGSRLVPLQFGRPCDASTEEGGPSDKIYGYRADVVETDIVGKRLIRHLTVADIAGIRGSYRFSPMIRDLI
ncbi:MAG: hypothetical protein IK009_06975 [Bacteroidales bacterium]|nr:hypothetical protein [Bacteroidales bacterium]